MWVLLLSPTQLAMSSAPRSALALPRSDGGTLRRPGRARRCRRLTSASTNRWLECGRRWRGTGRTTGCWASRRCASATGSHGAAELAGAIPCIPGRHELFHAALCLPGPPHVPCPTPACPLKQPHPHPLQGEPPLVLPRAIPLTLPSAPARALHSPPAGCHGRRPRPPPCIAYSRLSAAGPLRYSRRRLLAPRHVHPRPARGARLCPPAAPCAHVTRGRRHGQVRRRRVDPRPGSRV
jgi:hypothetical protein